MTFNITTLIVFIVAFLLGGLTLILYSTSGYRRRGVRKVRLLGNEFEFEKFTDLSVVKTFIYLSQSIVGGTKLHSNISQLIELKPQLAVNLGWSVVADSYSERFGSYPGDEDLATRVSELGAQNVDTIKVFREFAAAAYKQAALDKEIVEQFVRRCPSLVERIAGRASKGAAIREMEDSARMFLHSRSL